MSSHRCRLMEAHDKRDLIEINQLIDLTDKPIGLNRDEIGWSRVRSNASNCICCCCNNSITLVTTDDSYILDHVPLDNIQSAQTNASLQYLALSNDRKIAIIDLVDNELEYSCHNNNNNNNNLATETKVVNLTPHGLTMNDIIFWRWIDDSNLAILSYEALYTCSVNQQHINHPAYTAFSNRSRYISMQKIFDLHQNISTLCQVYDIQRDLSGNFYAISSLYSTSSLMKMNSFSNTHQPHTPPNASSNTPPTGSSLRPNYGSMPSKLSQLVNYDCSESLKSEQLYDHRYRQINSLMNQDEVGGLVQVYCKMRDRSQLIQVHAVTFTKSSQTSRLSPIFDSPILTGTQQASQRNPTILVAANKIANQLRVHFIELASHETYSLSTAQNTSATARFSRLSSIDFPSSVVCSQVDSPNNEPSLHMALITTKHGQLFVCSVTHSTILFNITIANDVISSTVPERSTQGLMVICRNGRVLLIQLKVAKLLKILDESKTLRHISSSSNIQLSSLDIANNNSIVNNEKRPDQDSSNGQSSDDHSKLSSSLDGGLDVLISTKL